MSQKQEHIGIEGIDYCQYALDVKAGITPRTEKHIYRCGCCLLKVLTEFARTAQWKPVGTDEAHRLFYPILDSFFMRGAKPHPRMDAYLAYLAANQEAQKDLAAAMYATQIRLNFRTTFNVMLGGVCALL